MSDLRIPAMVKRVELTNLVPDGSFEDVANNARYLRNDGLGHTITPSDIGMRLEDLTITYEDGSTGTLEVYKK